MIVTLKFSTQLAFSEKRDFRKTMEAFFQGQISYEETAERLNDNIEGLSLALGALFVLGQQKNPGFRLTVTHAPIAYKWHFLYRRLKN